jgi:hypothetical protein
MSIGRSLSLFWSRWDAGWRRQLLFEQTRGLTSYNLGFQLGLIAFTRGCYGQGKIYKGAVPWSDHN